MNENKKYILQRHEANLLILGNMSDDLIILKEKEMLDESTINSITEFLLETVSNPVDGKLMSYSYP